MYLARAPADAGTSSEQTLKRVHDDFRGNLLHKQRLAKSV
jgi:hypothetical protein